MHESLALFYTTIHSPWFHSTSIILFLNKTDILGDKIQTSDLQKYFPSFAGEPRMFVKDTLTLGETSSINGPASLCIDDICLSSKHKV